MGSNPAARIGSNGEAPHGMDAVRGFVLLRSRAWDGRGSANPCGHGQREDRPNYRFVDASTCAAAVRTTAHARRTQQMIPM